MKRRLAVLLVFALLTISIMPMPAFAATPSSTTLTQAIQKVKQNFVIPAAYTEFSSNYSEADNRKIISLNWNSPSQEGGNFSAQVDVTTNEIVSMNQWQPRTGAQTAQIPRLSVTDARTLGEKMLARLVPSRVKSLRAMTNNQLISLSSYTNPSCSLRWQRYAGTIPVSGDTAYMDIDLVTGQINSFGLNWTEFNLPKTEGVISPAQALKAFKEAGMLELSYQIPAIYGPLSASEKNKDPRLVYQVGHVSGGIIDALTGKPITLESGHWLTEVGAYGMGGMELALSSKAKSYDQAVQLTPQEQGEVDSTAKLISQQEAEAIVQKFVMSQFNTSLTLRNVNLEKDWQDANKKIWSFSWTGAAKSNGDPGNYLFARVNAVNGELVSFNYDINPNNEAKLNSAEAKQAADDFIKLVAASKMADLRPSPLQATYRYPNSPYSFSYQRMVNGVVCPSNGIELSVDPVTGKVTNYNLNWSDKVFPSAAAALSLDKAYTQFNSFAPLTLSMVPEWSSQGLLGIRLVYRPLSAQENQDAVIIDAQNGVRLDSSGKPVTAPPHAFSFSDIRGVYGEKEISILGQAGLMGEYNSKFQPAGQVQLVTLLRAMLGCRNGVYSVNGQTDEEIAKQAREIGLLKDNLPLNTIVTKELFCRLLTRYLGIEYLAQLPSIYKTTWRDVPASLNGYTTLVTGLSLIDISGNKFEPAKPITRAQAAVGLVRSIPRMTIR